MESLQLGWVELRLESEPEDWFHAQCPWVPAWVVHEGVVGMVGQLVLVLLSLFAVRGCIRLAVAAAGPVFVMPVVHGCGGPSEAFA